MTVLIKNLAYTLKLYHFKVFNAYLNCKIKKKQCMDLKLRAIRK